MPHHETRKSVTIFEREYLRMHTSELYKILKTWPLGSELLNKSEFVKIEALDAELFTKLQGQ